MGFLPHSVRRSGSSVIYFKQSEHIEDLLTTIGAPAAAMDIMTAKVDKEIRNGANRAMNCDMANVNKPWTPPWSRSPGFGGWRAAGGWPKCRRSCARRPGCGWITRRCPCSSWQSAATRR